MRRLMTSAAIAAITIALQGTAAAVDPRDPDWPCHQIRVPTLSVASFWTGPAIDDVGDAWTKDQTVHDLVLQIARRRTPLPDAEKAAGDFVAGAGGDRQEKAKLLFAGLFAELNSERDSVMAGIMRFSQRQQELREKISTEIADLRAKQDAAGSDAAEVNKLGEQVAWDTRIFDERRHTISYVCDVPTTIERRLFALARAIQQKLD